MHRLIALAFAGMFDFIGSAATALGDYCNASANCIGDAIEQREKEQRRKERTRSALDKVRREIEALPVAER